MNANVTQVDRMLSDHLPFSEIEEWIDGVSTAEEEKAALWLFAWSAQPETIRRRTVNEALSVVETRG